MNNYKTITTKTIEEFCLLYEHQINLLTPKDICIFDIDGVFFNGLLDFSFWRFKMKKSKSDSLKNIIIKNPACWIFTDRPRILLKPLEKSLKVILSPDKQMFLYDNATQILDTESYSPHRAVIYNAKKSEAFGEIIIKAAVKSFDKIYYFASQDGPIIYRDRELLDKISGIGFNLENLTFIDVRK